MPKFYHALGFLLVLQCFSHPAQGQTEEDFEQFGRQLFRQMTDSNLQQEPEYIRIRLYRQWIEKQPWTTNEKAQTLQYTEENFELLYEQYYSSMKQLRQYYREAARAGAHMEYLHTRVSPWRERKHRDAYTLHTRFLYRHEGTQTLVTWQYDVAYFDHFLVLFSGIKERF